MIEGNDKEIRRTHIDAMRKTHGWSLFEEDLLCIRERAVTRLVKGSPSEIDPVDIAVSRARIRLIDEIMSSLEKD